MRQRSSKSKFLRRLFTLRNLGFRCKDEEKTLFYRSEWSDNRLMYFLYHLVIASYVSGCTVARLIVNWNHRDVELLYFAVWAELQGVLYFILALVLSIVGVARGKISNRMEHGSIKFLRSATWLLFTLSSNFQLLSTVIYWPLSLLQPNYYPKQYFDIYLHVVFTLVILLEVAVSAFPIRILHFVYSLFGVTAYIIMTVALNPTGNNTSRSMKDASDLLDWNNSTASAAGVSIGVSVFGTLLAQLLFFCLYAFRIYISRSKRCNSRYEPNKTEVIQAVSVDKVNQSYDPESDFPERYHPKPNDYF